MQKYNESYENLLRKHEELETNIKELYKNFGDDHKIKELKTRKLSLKEKLSKINN